MLILIVLWWFCAQLVAPSWCFVCIGFVLFLRLFISAVDIAKIFIKADDKTDKK